MIRKLARPMIASVYIADGVDTIVNAPAHVEGTEEVVQRVRVFLPRKYARLLSKDPEKLTKIGGATKIAAGTTLALGKFPRLSAAVLAAISIPSILARYAFWETQDREEKVARKQGFLTSLALLGGLFITSADTAGKPGLKWRASKATKQANKKIQAALPSSSEKSEFVDSASQLFDEARTKASTTVEKIDNYVEENKDDWLKTAKENTKLARKKLVKAASAAQDRAEAAFSDLEKEGENASKKANKKAQKLQKQATKFLEKAQKRYA